MAEPTYPPYDVTESRASSDTCEWCDEGTDLDYPHHHELYVSRDGAASRTADNLAATFLDDVADLSAYIVPEWVAGIEWDRDYSAGWCVDPDDSQALSDEIITAESALGDAGFYVAWDDGYVIERVVEEEEGTDERKEAT